jgi:hypothetical protein
VDLPMASGAGFLGWWASRSIWVSPVEVAGRGRSGYVRFLVAVATFRAGFRSIPAMVCRDVGRGWKRGRRRIQRDRWPALGWPDGRVPTGQSEPEGERSCGERESRGRGERKWGFPKRKP